jgi:hypothetical protein
MSDLRITERTVRQVDCPSGGTAFEHVTGFLSDARGAYATYFAACHRHPEPEAQIDVVLGTWGTDETVDHLAFSCRLRGSGAMIVDATVATDSEDPVIGRKLSRDDALVHPWLARFWAAIDFPAAWEPTITAHLTEAVRQPRAD